MRRIVYSPKVWAYIKVGKNRVVDISQYIVSGTVTRRLNAVSAANLTIRNPDRIWTDPPGKPTFRPMDPITIYMMRQPGRPVQVFTGYLNRTPYYPLYPGTVTLSASCTLKKLLYTYFDPGLPYTQQFMMQYGWTPDHKSGTLVNIPAEMPELSDRGYFHDSGIGSLTFGTLRHIGGWNSNAIWIEKLPSGLTKRLAKVFNQFRDDNDAAIDDYQSFLHKYLGPGQYGNTEGGVGADVVNLRGGPNVEKAFNFLRDKGFNAIQAAGAVGSMMQESGTSLDPNALNSGSGAYGIAQWLGGRLTNLKQRQNPGFLSTQLNFLWDELQGPERAAYESMKNASSLYDATYTWTSRFERPGAHEYEMDKRLGYAKSVLAQYSNNPTGGTQRQRDGNDSEERPGAGNTGYNSTPADVEKTDTYAKRYRPIGAQHPVSGPWGTDRGDHVHAGVDWSCPVGTLVHAAMAGTVQRDSQGDTGYGNFITINHGNGIFTRYAHLSIFKVENGKKVKANDVIAESGDTGGSTGPHLHFEVRNNGGWGDTGTVDPIKWLQGAANPTGGTPSGGDGSDLDDGIADPKAAAFATTISFASAEDTIESLLLQGRKSLMNDKPLMPFIEQLCTASMRQFQSLPDGRFFAFFPDYFGEFQGTQKPYWEIYDTEILDGGIELNDEELVTHQFVVGETIPFAGIDLPQKLLSSGVVDVFNAFNAGGTADETPLIKEFEGKKGKEAALAFLNRYGARPDYHEAPMIRSPYFELLLAWQRFMLAWSRQFNTEFTFTFMPELYPGGKVGFADHGIKMFIEEVTHSFDYTGGFTTTATLTAPSAWGQEKKSITSGLVGNRISG